MKKTQCLTLTLITFVVLAFLPNSFAQEIKTYLLIPNDRTAPDDIDATLDSMIKDAQSMFKELMEENGFGSKTFPFEADSNGNAVVQHVTGQHNDAWYHDKHLSHVTDELDLTSDSKSLVIIDVSGGNLYNVAQATDDVALLPASGSYFEADIIAHELAHTFGLLHHAIKGDTLISNSYTPDLMLSSYCFAEWLDVHPYFNPGQTSSSGSTTIQMLTPVASPPDTVLLRFQITDSDGLHQAQITTGYDVIACKPLSSENVTIEFAINDQLGLITSNGSFSLYVIDVYGSYSSETFTTDISTLLTPTNISFPDDNLAAAIREHLGIASGNPISSQDMQQLENFYPTNHQISDLTGIEYAVNTKSIGFINNNIQDITPLAGLSQLIAISLDDNQISDLTPLAGLINLHFLNLDKNQISDLTPLADLTRLKTLILSDNQITDVNPLSNLVNLTDLRLRGNRIQNRTPLQTLQNQNPDLIIDNDPVTVVNRSPVFSEGSNATRSVFEETEANVNIGGPITATDADNDALTYTLSGVDAASFTINQLTGQLTTKEGVELDYETKSTYTITVTVSDTQGNTDTINVTINILDLNEIAVNNPPVFSDSSVTRLVPEGVEAGTNIGSPVTATDPDTGDTLTYTLGGTDAESFVIDTTTGQLKTKASVELDFETKSSYTLTVTATDPEGLTDTIMVNINIQDVNETAVNNPPVFSDSSITRLIPEGVDAETNIGSPVTATDPDTGDTLTYTLGGTDAGSFVIDSATGQLKTKAGVELDFETKSSYTITVTATDPEGLTATIVVNINIQDVNETADNNPPVFSDSSVTRLIPEGVSAGTNIGSPVTATDPDTGDTLTYTLGGTDKDVFVIDSATGQLKTKTGVELDFETKPSYTITVIATDTEGLTDTITVNIYIEDTDEGGEVVTITIPDEKLASAIRVTLSLEVGAAITQSDMEQLESLSAANQEITDLTGLEYAINLQNLVLTDNQISDIRPLSGLITLVDLSLQNNQISDVTPLSGLINLDRLDLVGNPVTNREPLLTLLCNNRNVKIYLKNEREPLPVTLSYFRAEHTNTGVVLKWTTESEVDNAGFYIYRSDTRDGEFKVINPTMIQGAGTTGERNKYTWTDTTAKLNTVYYYRIKDVSHAGEREQLATVRIKGLVSAKGKSATLWAVLKGKR